MTTTSTEKFSRTFLTRVEYQRAVEEAPGFESWELRQGLARSYEAVAYIFRNDNVMAASLFRMIKHVMETGGSWDNLTMICDDPQGFIDYFNS